MLEKKTFLNITADAGFTTGSELHKRIDAIIAQLLGAMKEVPWWEEHVP